MSLLLGSVVLAFGLMGNQSADLPALVPQPAEYQRKSGNFEVLPSTVIVSGNESIAEANRLAQLLRKATGYPLPIRPTKPAKDYIEFDLKPEMKWLGREGYRVSVRPDYVSIRSFGLEGLFYGMQSLRQLLPHEIESKEPIFRDWLIPSVEISDSPRFEWRGMHLDESRHFYGKDSVKKFIDMLALFKFNKFHWHLVDDGGWRIEIKKYPDLTRIGAWRIGDGRGFNQSEIFFNQNDGVYQVYGGFYTQEEIQEVVQYAADRHIEIIPEIEMPGHSLAALWVNRQLACDEASVNRVLPQIRTQFVTTFCPGKAETYQFLEDIVDEVTALFPGKYVHIGGDEVDRRTWETCTDCVAMRERERLSGTGEEYVYFMQRMARYVKSKGKQAIGWDDVLESGIPANLYVMSWLGDSGAKRAAENGIPSILAPQQLTYFDREYEITSVQDVYGFDPMPKGLSQAQQGLILGGQGQIWTEKLETWGELEQMAFPRVLAMSEALWSQVSVKNWNRFSAGLASQTERLDALAVQSHVPKPDFDEVLIAFRDSTVLPTPNPPSGMKAKITSDGSDPTNASEDFIRPFVVMESKTVKVSYARESGAVGQPYSVHYLRYSPPSQALEPGLWADWYGGRFRSVDGLSGSVERTDVETWANQWRFLNDPFGVRFSGYLRIPADGTYTFSLKSDDGSRLSFAGMPLLDLPAVGIMQAGQVTVKLVKGDYPFELLYFNGGGSRELLWEVEAAGFRRRSVPTEWLFRAR